MIDIREATDSEVVAWSAAWARRIQDWYGSFGAPDEWVASQVQRKIVVPDGVTTDTHALVEAGELVGYVTVRIAPQGTSTVASIVDIWVVPTHRRRGIGTSARLWAETWAREQRQALFVVIKPADEASSALFRAYPVRFQTMMKHLTTVGGLPDGVDGRPMTEGEFASWRAESVRGYASDMADSGVLPPDEAMTRSQTQFDELLPDGLGTPDHSFWTLYAGSDPVATNWLRHHHEPSASFVFGVEVSAEHRGHGYGRAAMVVGEQASIDAGDSYLALNVFGHNTVAINLYNSMGYQVTEQGRSIEAP